MSEHIVKKEIIGEGANKEVSALFGLATVIVRWKHDSLRITSRFEDERDQAEKKAVYEYKAKFDLLEEIEVPSIASLENKPLVISHNKSGYSFYLPNLQDMDISKMTISEGKTSSRKAKNVVFSHESDISKDSKNKLKELDETQKRKILTEAKHQLDILSSQCTENGIVLSNDGLTPYDDIFFCVLDTSNLQVKLKILLGDLDHLKFDHEVSNKVNIKNITNDVNDLDEWEYWMARNSVHIKINKDEMSQVNQASCEKYLKTLENLLTYHI